jgi:hypothetical protein
MPDICMCEGHGCSLKESCYRYTAEPSKYQSYFSPPFNHSVEECEYFSNNGEKENNE